MITWIFFDIGNVILNDDPAMAYFYHEIFQAVTQNGKPVTLEQILADRERSILEQRNGKHYETVGKKYLPPREWQKVEKRIRRTLAEKWAEFSPVIPGIVPVIEELAAQFHLGIIANQPLEVIPVLKKLGIWRYFQVHGISQLVRKTKPDPAFFQWAVEQAGCQPGEAVMIGDRIDNDIAPARSIGMKSIWLHLPLTAKGYHFKSLARASVSHLPPREAAETPEGKAQDFRTLLAEIEQIKNQ